ncbi:MAG: GerMN domain-containing protein [Firmicutes bacterium]|nr:GerMN domain-containing protein [Bacillota bacterium]
MRAVKIGLIVLVVLVMIVGSYKLFSLHKQVQELQKQNTQQTSSDVVRDVQTERGTAVIYLIKSEPTDFHLIPVHRQIGGPVNPTSAVQALLNGPLVHEELYAAVPTNTKLLNLTVRDGLATADFSREIIEDFQGGSLLESYLVQAIVNTLTEFDTIERVQILVEGKIVESIGGHILITQPLRRN